jgi:hypothetical protein
MDSLITAAARALAARRHVVVHPLKFDLELLGLYDLHGSAQSERRRVTTAAAKTSTGLTPPWRAIPSR